MEFLSISSPSSAASSATTEKWNRGRIRVKELHCQGTESIGKEVVVKGWIRTSRLADKNKIMFIELTDGSTVLGVQIVVDVAKTVGADDVMNRSGGAGASISVRGTVVPSTGKGQSVEIAASTVEVVGAVYGAEDGGIGGKMYPMSKKQHSLEFLREKAHLRIRSKMFSSAMRLRNAMAFATHKFFNERGFVYTHTPLITGADCEGAGEQFTVTTLLSGENAKTADIPTDKAGNVDFSKDFFGKRCNMTVSGQLNVETHACALCDVYTFGPTFRAENSHTSRHLAEFWMIEPEICFADLKDDMALAEDYVKFCTNYALDHCAEDLKYFEEEYPAGERGLRDRLRNVVAHDFAQITYTQAIETLNKLVEDGTVLHKIVTKEEKKSKSGKVEIKEKISFKQMVDGVWTWVKNDEKSVAAANAAAPEGATPVTIKPSFERIPSWGDDLGSEHERYLCEKIFARPTIVTDYPKDIKAFYMKLNPDGRTVAAMDILVPKIGELIGGAQREENKETLEARCAAAGVSTEDLWWYMDLRKYGTVPHAGFGLGFERLVMFVSGLENIRDVIPFPRVPGHAEF